jgi:hypothetical protein
MSWNRSSPVASAVQLDANEVATHRVHLTAPKEGAAPQEVEERLDTQGPVLPGKATASLN